MGISRSPSLSILTGRGSNGLHVLQKESSLSRGENSTYKDIYLNSSWKQCCFDTIVSFKADGVFAHRFLATFIAMHKFPPTDQALGPGRQLLVASEYQVP